jgi:hypothetical protein
MARKGETTMNRKRSVTWSRVASVLALVSAVLIPWYGWQAAAGVGVFVLAGALMAPHASLPHRGRLRLLAEAVRRRVVRSPWRMKRL